MSGAPSPTQTGLLVSPGSSGVPRSLFLVKELQRPAEVFEALEGTPLDEVLLKVVKGPFHFSLRSGISYPAGYRPHAVVSAELKEAWVPPEVGWMGVNDKDAVIIDHQVLRGATKSPQPVFYPFKGGSLAPVQAGKVTFPTAETEDEAKDYHPDKTAADGNCIWRPVKLSLLTRRRFIADAGFGLTLLRLDLAQGPVECHLGAIIAPFTEFLEDAAANLKWSLVSICRTSSLKGSSFGLGRGCR